jgi:hypothetical protein
MTFIPDQVKIIDILFIGIIETNLLPIAIIFQLPIRWRGNNEVNGFIGNFFHPPRIPNNDFMKGFHIVNPLRIEAYLKGWIRTRFLLGQIYQKGNCVAREF